MLEPWDEVLTLQKERLLCAEDVQTIKALCTKEHGKKHVMECAECWERLVNRMGDRYLHAATKEWFSGRRAFLSDLDTMFSKAKTYEIDFKAIEQRIYEEKKEWYRDKVRNLGLQSAITSPAEARALQQKLNDRSITADQLASDLKETFSDGAIRNQEAFSGFLERLRTAKSPKARTDAYVDIFFQPDHDPAGAAKSQKYIEMVRDGVPIAEALNTMLRDRQTAKGDLEQKQKLQKKLEELKRAKTAHELDKAKHDKARQDKARAAASSSGHYDLPPCSVCSKDADRQDFIACLLCQVVGHYGIRNEPAVFCSQACHDNGYESHMYAMHNCAAGQGCATMNDEDEEMDTGEVLLVVCRECVEELDTPSIFCSSRCFDANFQQHRDSVHLVQRQKAQREVNDEGQLGFDADDKTRYRARKIEDHLVTVNDALAAWQQKTGATVF